MPEATPTSLGRVAGCLSSIREIIVDQVHDFYMPAVMAFFVRTTYSMSRQRKTLLSCTLGRHQIYNAHLLKFEWPQPSCFEHRVSSSVEHLIWLVLETRWYYPQSDHLPHSASLWEIFKPSPLLSLAPNCGASA